MSQSKVPIEAIRGLITDALAAAGLPREDAAKCAELMGEADLTGADAHGVFRLPQYVRRLKAGGFNPKPNITVQRSAPATALVDGDNAMGHLVMSRAAETAISIAREMGVSWVGVRRSNHAGPAGLYAEMPAAAGHDRHLCGGRERQPHGGVGRRRSAARHQSAGDRRAVGRGAAGARHGDDGRLLRHGEELCAAGKAHGKGLDGQHRDRRGHHRCEARRRGPAAPDRRLQGLRACRDARADRRPAQPCGVRARRDRLQCRRCERNQHGALHPRARHRALPAAR